MAHLLYDVVKFTIVGSYTLQIHFDDQTEQIIDFEPVLHGELYGPLKDPKLFHQVRLDPETRTLVWPNGADFDPWMLHEWPSLADKLIKQARSWDLVAA
jgi:hypothetical protein